MLLDKQGIFADNQSAYTNCYSVNNVYFGKGDVSYVPLLIQVVLDFVGLTSLTVDIETSSVSNFATYTTLASATLPLASLKAGARFPISFVPKGNLGYMRLKFIVTGTGTAGKITAGVMGSVDSSWQDQ